MFLVRRCLTSALSGPKWLLDGVLLLDRQGFWFGKVLYDRWKEARRNGHKIRFALKEFESFKVLPTKKHMLSLNTDISRFNPSFLGRKVPN